MEKNTKIGDILNLPELEPVKSFHIGGVGDGIDGAMMSYGELTLESVEAFGQNAASLQYGLERLLEVAASEKQYVFPIYSTKEIQEETDKKMASLIYFPTKAKVKKRPYIIVIPGGAYMCTVAISEGYPVAARWNDLGYDAFILNYRVGGENVTPKAIDDLAQAVRYIKSHEKELDVDGSCYIVGGFSAGGNLTGQWVTVNHGYKVYGLPKPMAVYTIYPAVNSALYVQENYDNDEAREKGVASVKQFLLTMFGSGASEEYIQSYDIDRNIDGDCPPCYISACKDDDMVPYKNSLVLKKRLDELGVAAVLDIGEKGGHGFSTGELADTRGWMERADAFFWNNIKRNFDKNMQ